MTTRKQNLIALRNAMVAGEVIQSNEACMLWPTDYSKFSGRELPRRKYIGLHAAPGRRHVYAPA